MSEIEPNAGDRELAEKICELERASHAEAVKLLAHGRCANVAFTPDAVAMLIARYRAAREAGLRAEIERLRQKLRGIVVRLAPLIDHLGRNASVNWSQVTRQEGNSALAAYYEAKKALENTP